MEEDYRKLKAGWEAGDRDRESALHLLFLSWMNWADPSFVTGMSGDAAASQIWHAVVYHFGGEASSDAEFLHVAGIMASETPWALGDEARWQATAARMEDRSLSLKSSGFSPAEFQGRGEYGKYFAHRARQRDRGPER